VICLAAGSLHTCWHCLVRGKQCRWIWFSDARMVQYCQKASLACKPYSPWAFCRSCSSLWWWFFTRAVPH